MVIRSIAVSQMRNHVRTLLVCAQHVNVLTGPNGSGKTTLLEAISMAAIARSFVQVGDSSLVQFGTDGFTVVIEAERDLDAPYKVSVRVQEGARKRIEGSLGTSLTPRDIIGSLPVVALSPDHKNITFGAPSERRAFLDSVMAQSSTRFTDLLYDLRRILKQRNALLGSGTLVGIGDADLHAWTSAFVTCSAEIIHRRALFIHELAPRVQRAYAAVSGGAERVEIHYEPDSLPGTFDPVSATVEEIAEALHAVARMVMPRELARGSTCFGAQRDEMVLRLNGGLARETASQGQHKSLLVALKLAECEILLEKTNERPVVLLDDVFSELDRTRCAQVMELVLAMGMQCFVTTTDGEAISLLVPKGTDMRLVTLSNGAVITREAA